MCESDFYTGQWKQKVVLYEWIVRIIRFYLCRCSNKLFSCNLTGMDRKRIMKQKRRVRKKAQMNKVCSTRCILMSWTIILCLWVLVVIYQTIMLSISPILGRLLLLFVFTLIKLLHRPSHNIYTNTMVLDKNSKRLSKNFSKDNSIKKQFKAN